MVEEREGHLVKQLVPMPEMALKIEVSKKLLSTEDVKGLTEVEQDLLGTKVATKGRMQDALKPGL